MSLKRERLGKFIRLVDNRNIGGCITNVQGVNITKNFMPSVANLSETDVSKYKIVTRGQFVFSPMQVGRDETVRVALFDKEEPVAVSPAYSVFEIKDKSVLMPEFLMMWFLRPEFDRYGWFISDGSVRSSLDWVRFCDIEIPVPEQKLQQVCVSIYKGMIKNHEAYEKSIYDLNLISKSYIENLTKNSGLKRLGDYVNFVDDRNIVGKLKNVKGVSTGKELISTVANLNGVNLKSYKIVDKDNFVYVPDTSRRGDKIAIALNNGDPCIVSSIYTVFSVDKAKLLPEYLLLWFKRSEFDRYARFHSIGSAREIFNFEEMCNVMLPVPEDIEVQKSIVAIHRVLGTRSRLDERLKSMITSICSILMKGITII